MSRTRFTGVNPPADKQVLKDTLIPVSTTALNKPHKVNAIQLFNNSPVNTAKIMLQISKENFTV